MRCPNPLFLRARLCRPCFANKRGFFFGLCCANAALTTSPILLSRRPPSEAPIPSFICPKEVRHSPDLVLRKRPPSAVEQSSSAIPVPFPFLLVSFGQSASPFPVSRVSFLILFLLVTPDKILPDDLAVPQAGSSLFWLLGCRFPRLAPVSRHFIKWTQTFFFLTLSPSISFWPSSCATSPPMGLTSFPLLSRIGFSFYVVNSEHTVAIVFSRFRPPLRVPCCIWPLGLGWQTPKLILYLACVHRFCPPCPPVPH